MKITAIIITISLVLYLSTNLNGQGFIQVSHVQCLGGKVSSTGTFKNYSVAGEQAVNPYRISSMYSGTVGFLTMGSEIISNISKNEAGLFNFSIAPNPNNGYFQISSFTEDYLPKDIFIYDAMGKLIYKNINNTDLKLNIDISKELPGIYLINVLHNKNIYSIRIVKL